MKRIFLAIILIMGLVASHGFALMGSEKGKDNHKAGGQTGAVLGHGQIMAKMIGIMKQMSEMMKSMSEKMTDVSAERLQNMKGLMIEMSEHMLEMSQTMKKGKVSEEEMRMLNDNMKYTHKKMSDMMK
jgi:hypothetical protein